MPAKENKTAETLLKMERYCAQSEKCVQDVKLKLRKIQIPPGEQEKIIRHLIKNGFVDEARFTKLFARDKLNLNGWGKIKIAIALRQKNLSEKNIQSGLLEIDDGEYFEKLKKLAERKAAQLKDEDDFSFRNKLATFLISRGFESNLAWDVVNEIKKG